MAKVVGFRIQIEGTDEQIRELKSIQKEIDDLTAVQKTLNKTGQRATKEFQENQIALKELRAEQRAVSSQVKTQNQGLKNLGNSYNDLTRQNRILSRQLRQIQDPLGRGKQEFDELSRTINTNTDKLKEMDAAMGRQFRNVGNYSSALDGLSDILQGIVPGLGNLKGGLDQVNQQGGQSTATIGSLGRGMIAALGPAAIAGTVIAAGTAVFNLQQKFEALRKEVNLLTGATGDELDQVTAAVNATAETFDKEFNEVLRSANALSKAFGISLGDSTDLIQKGFAIGADQSGEFLDILREYPELLKEVGLTAEQTVSLIDLQTEEGIFSDKGIDAIKEAGLRLRELTPATKEALDGIGLSSREIEKALTSGSKSVFDVVQDVSKQLATLPPQSAAVGTAIADIFGGPGEDAGLRFITLLGDVNSNLDETVEKSGEFAQQQLELVKVNEELDLIINQALGGADGLFQEAEISAKQFAVEGLGTAIEASKEFINAIIGIINAFRPLRGIIGLVRETVVLNFRLMFESATLLFRPLDDLAKAFKALVTGDFEAIPRILKQGFTDIVDRFKDLGKDTAEGFTKAWEDTVSEGDFIKPLQTGEVEKEFSSTGNRHGQSYGSNFNKAVAKEDKKLVAQRKSVLKEVERLLKEQAKADAQFEKEQRAAQDASIKDANDFRLKQAKQFYKDLDEARKRDLQAELDQQEAKKQAAILLANATLAFLEQANKNNLNAQLRDIERKEARELELAKNNQEQQDAIRKKFDEERRKLRIKEAQQAKILAIIQATINTAVAVTEKLSVPVLAAAIGAAGALQVAAIASQPIPEFAKGGLVEGKSHAQGGEKFAVGGRVVELEGGEAVINKRSTRAFKPLLSALNVAGGGKKFQTGGIPSPVISAAVNTAQPQIDIGLDGFASQIIQGINTKQVVVSEQDITETQTNVAVNEQLGTF